jgi:hypothetical protein
MNDNGKEPGPVPTAQEQVEAIDAAIATLLSGGVVQEYEINGRRLERYSLAELRDLRKMYMGEVQATGGNRTKVAFQEPT